MTVPVVVIGRNEGARFVRCLASLKGRAERIVYVDSGSSDASVDHAREAGAIVVELDMSRPFTAARARNAGLSALLADAPATYVQFLDGDCEMRDGWMEAATAYLEAQPEFAITCGRLRERYPEASFYNRVCDQEWATEPGEMKKCGGIFMARVAPLRDLGGFNEDLVAGEEPELCLRLRRKGWRIWRLDHEMAWHDAAMTRLSEWWTRATRAGLTYAEGAVMYGAGPERYNVKEALRAAFWGAALPAALLFAACVTPWALLGFALYPLRAARLARRDGGDGFAWRLAGLNTLGKFAEALGMARYFWRRLFARPAQIIEYKK